MAGLNLNCPLKLSQRVAEQVFAIEDDSASVVSIGMPLSELKREVEGSERVIESVELVQDEAAIDEGLHVVGASEQGVLQGDEGVFGSAQGKEGSAFG